MMIKTIFCACCSSRCEEDEQGGGWPGWGQLCGISLNGDDNPYLCPNCLSEVAEKVDEMTERLK